MKEVFILSESISAKELDEEIKLSRSRGKKSDQISKNSQSKSMVKRAKPKAALQKTIE